MDLLSVRKLHGEANSARVCVFLGSGFLDTQGGLFGLGPWRCRIERKHSPNNAVPARGWNICNRKPGGIASLRSELGWQLRVETKQPVMLVEPSPGAYPSGQALWDCTNRQITAFSRP